MKRRNEVFNCIYSFFLPYLERDRNASQNAKKTKNDDLKAVQNSRQTKKNKRKSQKPRKSGFKNVLNRNYANFSLNF